METKAVAAAVRFRPSSTYHDFEPYCEWQRETGRETLILHLPDFQKNELKVQVNNLGILRINGERPLNEDGTRISRFCKETKIPYGCEINRLHAKFSKKRLLITMPKKITVPNYSSANVSQVSQSQPTRSICRTSRLPAANNETSAEEEIIVPRGQRNALRDRMGTLRLKGVKTKNLLMVGVALGAYAMYRCTSCN